MLRKIYSLTLGDNCFSDALNLLEIQELLQFDVWNVASDDILSKLTILHRMFRSLSRGSCCPKLIDICNYLVDNNVITVLSSLMGVDNQYVVYMSAKAMISLVMYRPSLIKKLQLQQHFVDCLKFKWKPIYLMKVLTQVVNSSCSSECQGKKPTSVSCKCSMTSNHMDTGSNPEHYPALYVNLIIEGSKEFLISSYCSLWKDIFENYIHSNTDTKYTNCELEKVCEVHRNTGAMVQQNLNKRCIEISNRNEQVLLSFLHFLSAFFKWKVTNDLYLGNTTLLKEHNQSAVMKNCDHLLLVIPLFVHILQDKGLSSEVWKSVVELLLSCLCTDTNENHPFAFVLSHHISVAIVMATTIGVLDKIPVCNGFEGFGGENIALLNSNHGNHLLRHKGLSRRISLLIIKASFVLMNGQNNGSLKLVIEALTTWLLSLLSNKNNYINMLLDMFADQDDEMLEMMLFLLKLHISLIKTNEIGPDAQSAIDNFNPHVLFVEFLSTIHFDHSVLLDFLVSSETMFLEYITCYLQLVLCDWKGFCNDIQAHFIKEDIPKQTMINGNIKGDDESSVGLLSSDAYGSDWNSLDDHDVLAVHDVDGVVGDVVTNKYDSDSVDDVVDIDDECIKDVSCSMLSSQSILERTMSCLIHLRISVQRLVRASLFPYNVNPLLKKFEAVENRFDGY